MATWKCLHLFVRILSDTLPLDMHCFKGLSTLKWKFCHHFHDCRRPKKIFWRNCPYSESQRSLKQHQTPLTFIVYICKYVKTLTFFLKISPYLFHRRKQVMMTWEPSFLGECSQNISWGHCVCTYTQKVRGKGMWWWFPHLMHINLFCHTRIRDNRSDELCTSSFSLCWNASPKISAPLLSPPTAEERSERLLRAAH